MSTRKIDGYMSRVQNEIFPWTHSDIECCSDTTVDCFYHLVCQTVVEISK